MCISPCGCCVSVSLKPVEKNKVITEVFEVCWTTSWCCLFLLTGSACCVSSASCVKAESGTSNSSSFLFQGQGIKSKNENKVDKKQRFCGFGKNDVLLLLYRNGATFFPFCRWLNFFFSRNGVSAFALCQILTMQCSYRPLTCSSTRISIVLICDTSLCRRRSFFTPTADLFKNPLDPTGVSPVGGASPRSPLNAALSKNMSPPLKHHWLPQVALTLMDPLSLCSSKPIKQSGPRWHKKLGCHST